MSCNSFGRLFRMTSWGESHGPAIGVVVDGCPPGIALRADLIQSWLDQRRPGTSRHVSPRQETDRVEILSGVYNGLTTGSPISLLIPNANARPADYEATSRIYRPGHADITYDLKYGVSDPGGGGRSSARETAARVAAGAIARLLIPQVTIRARLVELGGVARTAECPEGQLDPVWVKALDEARHAGDSLGGVIECAADGVPAGWGAPVYARLDADLAGALMSINAVKGVEVGAGFEASRLRGSQNADGMTSGSSGIGFLSNHSGGVLGGISNGDQILVRAAFKPTPSIRMPIQSINKQGEEVMVSTRGRHDPCVAVRAAPIVEAMVALVLADHKLLDRAQCGSR